MEKNKDKRINIRLDEETYEAMKELIAGELNTDISNYCRTLLSSALLYKKTISQIRELQKKFPDTSLYMDDYVTDASELFGQITKDIKGQEALLASLKNDLEKFEMLISTFETNLKRVKSEANAYADRYRTQMKGLMDDLVKQGWYEEGIDLGKTDPVYGFKKNKNDGE